MRIRNPLFLPLVVLLVLASLYAAGSPDEEMQPGARIGTIDFEGNESISSGQLKRVLRMSREGGEYVPRNLQADLRRVEKIYQDSGFLNVELEQPEVQFQAVGDRKAALIRIVVKEGPLYTTGETDVRNASALAPESLRQMCPLQKGRPYSRTGIARWQAKIEEAYRAMGYLKIRCPARETVNEAGRIIDCVLECVEGKIYRIGKITVTGDGSVNPAQFRRMLLFSEGGIFNPEMVVLSTQFINQTKRYRPISDSDLDIRIDDDSGTVDLSLRVVPLPR